MSGKQDVHRFSAVMITPMMTRPILLRVVTVHVPERRCDEASCTKKSEFLCKTQELRHELATIKSGMGNWQNEYTWLPNHVFVTPR